MEVVAYNIAVLFFPNLRHLRNLGIIRMADQSNRLVSLDTFAGIRDRFILLWLFLMWLLFPKNVIITI